MKSLKTMLVLSAFLILATAPMALARDGGHGGGARGGGHVSSGRFHSGPAFHGGPVFRGYWGGPGVYWGWPYHRHIYFGWGWPYYPGPYPGWPYPYDDYPYYHPSYSPDAVPPDLSGLTPVYSWYFCKNPEGYYPYVKECPGGWTPVTPPKQSPGPEAPAPSAPPASDPDTMEDPPVQPAGKPLTNDAVIALAKAGVGDAVIVMSIQNSPGKFDLGPEALTKLKDAGVSDAVTAAMTGRMEPSKPGASQQGPTQATVQKLLEAIAANDYDAFVANAAPELKTNITKESFTEVSTDLSPDLKKGYELVYEGSLQERGAEVFMWKVTFKDSGDEILLRMVLQGNKVAGFWMQ